MEMKIAQKMTWLLMFLLVTACSMSSTPMTVDPNASGQIEIDATQVKMILGGNPGSGILNFQGYGHAFSTNGMKLDGVGIDASQFTGNVYNLNKLEDFEGTYLAADAGAPGKSLDGVWMKNDDCVYIHLNTNTSSLSLVLGAEGIKFNLK